MIKFLIRIVLNIVFTALLLFAVHKYSNGWFSVDSTKYDVYLTFWFLAVVFFVLNTVLKRILKIVTLPLKLLTFWLFSILLNILILYIFKYVVNVGEFDMHVELGTILQVVILSFFLMIPNLLAKLFK